MEITRTFFILLFIFSSHLGLGSENNKPWIRLKSAIEYLKVDPKNNTKLAYSLEFDAGLGVIDLKTKKISKLSSKPVQGSYDWAPDGIRLVFRERFLNKDGKITSQVNIYDSVLEKIIPLETIPHSSGYLAIDPVDYKLHLLHENGVMRKQLKLPDSRLARWQLKLKEKPGYWLATQKAPIFLPKSSIEMQSVTVHAGALHSYDISSDGLSIAWATTDGKIYASKMGEKPRFVDLGMDPKWFHHENKLVYAGARKVGEKTVGYDLKISAPGGTKKWITHTYHSDERWPVPLKDKSILYTKDKTTDLYALRFSEISRGAPAKGQNKRNL